MSTDAASTRAPTRRTHRVTAALVGIALGIGVVTTSAPAASLTGQSRTDKTTEDEIKPKRQAVTIDRVASTAVDAVGAATDAVELGANVVAYLDAQRRAAEAAELARAVETYQAAVAAERSRTAVWDRIAQCETGGNWGMTGSRYSGGLGFANTTWDSFGGREFATNAGLASRSQQIIVAERLRDYGGYSGWGCAYTLGIVSR